MNKNEILAAAQTEGIPLSIHQLNRYIRLGLLPSERQGNGYKGGVEADYPDAMRNIRFIEQARQNRHLGHYKHLLPYLFWHGYPVRTDILQVYMLDYQKLMQRVFQHLNEGDPDQVNLDSLLDEMIDDPDVRALRPPGRPSASEQTKRSKEDKELRLFMHQLVTWMHQFQLTTNKQIQASEIMVSLSLGRIQNVDPSEPFLLWLQAFIDGFRWLEPGETIDWSQITTLATAMHEYSDDFAWLTSTFLPPTVTRVPEHFKAHPRITALLILLILVSRQAPLLHALLFTDSFRVGFKQMMDQLKGGIHDASDPITH